MDKVPGRSCTPLLLQSRQMTLAVWAGLRCLMRPVAGMIEEDNLARLQKHRVQAKMPAAAKIRSQRTTDTQTRSW